MHCGLSVPSLRWGAVRNRQLYILRMYCKSCISFNFSFFFYNLHALPQKKKNHTHLPQKNAIFSLIIYTTRRFFCTRLTRANFSPPFHRRGHQKCEPTVTDLKIGELTSLRLGLNKGMRPRCMSLHRSLELPPHDSQHHAASPVSQHCIFSPRHTPHKTEHAAGMPAGYVCIPRRTAFPFQLSDGQL